MVTYYLGEGNHVVNMQSASKSTVDWIHQKSQKCPKITLRKPFDKQTTLKYISEIEP